MAVDHVEHCRTAAPEQLIGHNGPGNREVLLQEGLIKGEHRPRPGAQHRMPCNADAVGHRHAHPVGNAGGDGRTGQTQLWRPKVAEDQGIIHHNIGQHTDHGAIHRHPHLLRGAQHGVGRILKAEGRKAQRHQPEIRAACGNDRRVRGIKAHNNAGEKHGKAHQHQRDRQAEAQPAAIAAAHLPHGPGTPELSHQHARRTGNAKQDHIQQLDP